MSVSVITMTDGTPVRVDSNLETSLPVVVLLHGLCGTSLDMTNPAVGAARTRLRPTTSA